LLELFRAYDKGDRDADPYKNFAGNEIYRIPTSQVSKTQRLLGKVCILGLGYQMGGPKFQYTVTAGIMGPKQPIELVRAKECVNAYRAKFPHIRDQWEKFQNMLPILWQGSNVVEYGPLTFEKGRIWLPNEMYLRYPNLRPHTEVVEGDRGEYTRKAWRYNEDSKIYGGLLVENVVQCLARIIVGEQLLKIAEQYRLVNIVHDEGIFCVKKRSAEKCLRLAERVFAQPPVWCPDLPVAGEGVISTEYVKP